MDRAFRFARGIEVVVFYDAQVQPCMVRKKKYHTDELPAKLPLRMGSRAVVLISRLQELGNKYKKEQCKMIPLSNNA